MKDCFNLKGMFTGTLFKADGSVETVFKQNLVVTTGLTLALRALFDASATEKLSYIAIGTGTAAVTASDTALVSEAARVQGTTTLNGTSTTITATFSAGIGTGAISEAGILTASSAGILFDRVVFSVKNKEADDVFQVSFTVTVSAG